MHADELRAALAAAPPWCRRQGIGVTGSPTNGVLVMTNLQHTWQSVVRSSVSGVVAARYTSAPVTVVSTASSSLWAGVNCANNVLRHDQGDGHASVFQTHEFVAQPPVQRFPCLGLSS